MLQTCVEAIKNKKGKENPGPRGNGEWKIIDHRYGYRWSMIFHSPFPLGPGFSFPFLFFIASTQVCSSSSRKRQYNRPLAFFLMVIASAPLPRTGVVLGSIMCHNPPPGYDQFGRSPSPAGRSFDNNSPVGQSALASSGLDNVSPKQIDQQESCYQSSFRRVKGTDQTGR
jgi:hypothetical protein